ncbi:MAG: 2-oxoacid:acceptor oxidoreductase family protein, partial [Atopobiaceae bacterium]|nr:2-oxoacid:acceptor oxidoreductase family protein [Atopobiaceae bacterium]
KDTPPASAFAVFEELKKAAPKREFTIGIVDDVTNLSLDEDPNAPITSAPGTIECKFWGLGGDGTVGANKNSIKIIGDHTDKYIQAYFQYDSKKTCGITISHLRFGDSPIRSPYYVNAADFVACHNPSYITKGFKMVQDVKPGGTFMINCQWSLEELEHHLNAEAKRYIANNDIRLVLINAIDLAIEVGMGKRTNTILQSAFFTLSGVLPQEDAIKYMKDAAEHSYAKKGQAIVEANWKAIDAGATAFTVVEVPESWKTATDEPVELTLEGREAIVAQVKALLHPIDLMDGDSLPVSAFKNCADGQFELGASAYEKRGVAVSVPRWDETKCIQCNSCANVCPHAAIRPFALSEDEAAAAPVTMRTLDLAPAKKFPGMKYTLAVSPLDCMGCAVCVGVCPKGAITMAPQEEELAQQDVFDFAVANVTEKPETIASNVKGIQFKKPLLEFSGSCAGCAETAYARLVTQVAGDHMFISNATGCSSIWGNPAATSPYTTNAEGHGPAWNNSLFEDNAEHGLGLYLGYMAVQNKVEEQVKALIAKDGASEAVKEAGAAWLEAKNDAAASKTTAAALIAALE